MNVFKPCSIGIAVCGWALTALCGNLMAEVVFEDAAAAMSSTRADWQQRVLRRDQRVHPEPEYRTAARVRPRLIPGRSVSTAILFEPEEIGPGTLSLDEGQVTQERVFEMPGDGMPEMIQPGMGEPGCGADCGDDFYGDCGGCGECGDCVGYPYDGYYGRCPNFHNALARIRSAWWTRDLSVFAGMHGFKGPVDLGRNGNFGLHEGLNFGGPLGGVHGIGYQFGFAVMHSNLSGDQTDGAHRGHRNQTFFTAGIFRRALCGGWQWGVALDTMHDSYYGESDLKQIRSETGYVLPGGQREIGFFGAYGIDGDDLILRDRTRLALEPTDMFALYYRRYFSGGGDGRIWAGVTGDGDALLGGDLRVPLGKGWAIENRLNYLIPQEGRGIQGQSQESWGLNIQLVWYVGQPARCALKSPFRPMFNVADNTTFLSDADRD